MVGKYQSCKSLYEWEDRHIYGKQRSEILVYKRFIDDFFFIWVGTEISLIKFIEGLNQNNNSIKLNCHWSREQINYLDVTVIICSKKVITKVYFKPKDRNSYPFIVVTIRHGSGTYQKDNSREFYGFGFCNTNTNNKEMVC